MIKRAIASLFALSLLPVPAHAEQYSSLQDANPQGRWLFGFNTSFISSALNVVDSELVLPEDVRLEDVELDFSEVELSGTSFNVSASYFVLPFMDVSLSAGLISSESDMSIDLTAVPGEGLQDLGVDAVSIAFPTSLDADGFSYSASFGIYLPITEIEGYPLLLRSGASWGRTSFEDADLETTLVTVSSNLIYAPRLYDAEHVFSLGLSHSEVNRHASRTTSLLGQTLTINTEQELVEPWALQGLASRKFGEHTALGYGFIYNQNGDVSHVFRLSYQPW